MREPPVFGRALRPLWALAAEGTFLNHGSYGACPTRVLDEQARIRMRMEAQPDAFFHDEIHPREGTTALRAAASALGAFVNVDGERIAFVENATGGAQAVLRSIDFRPGDRILLTSHTYNAVRLMVEARCAETGAKVHVVPIPIPTDAAAILARFEEALAQPVRLAIVDHITSPTATVFPLRQIIEMLHRRGALVFVDGAHGVGQVPLDLAALAPDWYVSNAHKWLYAPKGTALLYASKEAAPMTHANVVSHYGAMGFPRAFDFTGTRDNSSWLAVPAAIAFYEELGGERLRAHQARLLAACSEGLDAMGARPVAPVEMCAAMRAFILPQSRAAAPPDAAELIQGLWRDERIQVWSKEHEGRLLLRVSAQAYVDEDDVRRLAAVLERRGWPARA
jgi:isopenicillin-N epimerase